jgi:uncharacterized protein
MAQLQAETDTVMAVLDGTVGDLLRSMDRAGIDAAVVASIATKPSQFEAILRWSDSIRSARILPFPSLQPIHPGAEEQVRRIAAGGYAGFKLHPYYQQFVVDDPRLDPVYRVTSELGLVILMHAGFDIAFPRERVADPARIRRVLERFPGLKMIAAHLGGWMDWDEVEEHLVGQPVYFDLSCSFDFIASEQAGRLLATHPRERLLYGSDSPWVDQGKTLEQFKRFGCGAEFDAAVLGGNAGQLLCRGLQG